MFSQTPDKPRRTTRRTSRAPLLSGQTTPRASPPPPSTQTPRAGALTIRASPAPSGSQALSALVGRRAATRSIAARSDVGSVFDGEHDGRKEDGAKVLVRDESYAVTERRGGLPTEVEQVLFAAGPFIPCSSAYGGKAERSGEQTLMWTH
jgi:hypothetical protein